jgi:hypothetical protein
VASTPVLMFFMPKNKKAIWPILFVLVSFLLIFLNGPHPRFLFGYMVSSLAFVFISLVIVFLLKCQAIYCQF